MCDFLINYNSNKKQVKKYTPLLKSLLKITVKILGIRYKTSLSLSYITEEESISMNNEYRNKDYVGDVISFPVEMDDKIINQINYRELGDIFICYDEAVKKAEKYKHDLKTEIAWLFIHGLLHILGYDHEKSKKDEKIMFDLTDKILEAKNIYYKIY